MGVIMQTFYWDCPNDIAQPFGWWKFIESKLNNPACSRLHCFVASPN